MTLFNLLVRMADRGGPYDTANAELRDKFHAEACILIVLSGTDGTGVSIVGPDDLKPHLPALFTDIAREVEDALAIQNGALFCPVCRANLAFHSRHDPRMIPPEGSLTVCAACASFLVRDARAWRLLTEAELVDLDDEVRNALTRTRRQIEHLRGPGN